MKRLCNTSSRAEAKRSEVDLSRGDTPFRANRFRYLLHPHGARHTIFPKFRRRCRRRCGTEERNRRRARPTAAFGAISPAEVQGARRECVLFELGHCRVLKRAPVALVCEDAAPAERGDDGLQGGTGPALSCPTLAETLASSRPRTRTHWQRRSRSKRRCCDSATVVAATPPRLMIASWPK